MLKHWWSAALVGTIVLVALSVARPDPAWYSRKPTWQETYAAAARAKARQDTLAKAQVSPGTHIQDPVKLGAWHQLGPFVPKEGRGFAIAFGPEKGIDLTKPCGGLSWEKVSYEDGQGQNLSVPDNGSLYLYRTITSDAPRVITAYLGSDDGLAVWLNGRQVLANDVPRVVAPDQDTVQLDLRQGKNDLLLKVFNGVGGSGFYFSLRPNRATATHTTALDDQPIWALLQRDFPSQDAARQMRWEQEDGIWAGDPDRLTVQTLAKRYGEAARGWEADGAKRFAATVRDAAGLAEVRALYHKGRAYDEAVSKAAGFPCEALRLAVADLTVTYGERYPKGAEYLARIKGLEDRLQKGTDDAAARELQSLRREALLANPLLGFDKLLLVKRGHGQMGLPQNWQGNSSIPATGYDNEIDVLSISTGKMSRLYRPDGSAFVGDIELHYDADRFLFSMPAAHGRFQLHELRTDGTGLRQVTTVDQPDVDNYSGTYLPDGRIVFCSTACYLGVPCVGGSDSVGSLYLLNEKDKSVRQLTFDQDHSWYPHVTNEGQVMYTRWEYSDIPHYFSRIVFKMNPDGTSQFAHYGSNSYWPNTPMYARSIPNDPSKFVAIVSGHHGVARMGELVIFDPSKGRQEAAAVVQRIPGYRKPVTPTIADQLVASSTPRFLHPYPLSGKYFLVSCQPDGHPWGIYLADIYDNLVCLAEMPDYALLEPVPIQKRTAPPAIPDRVKLADKTATVFLEDVYRGPGLRGVPRGSVKALRVIANHYGYRGMGGHVEVGVDGPWDVKRILGTVPVDRDGSAMFKVPANLPIIVQPLDAQGRALATMRSWYTAMPGEVATCVGCHESQNSSPMTHLAAYTRRKAVDIQPWLGPARGFSFEREVQQQVLQPYCVSCHNGRTQSKGVAIADFRAKADVPEYRGRFTPAYEALHRYVRRPGNESDYRMPMAAEWNANTSELVQLLKKGHYGVSLPREAWDRLYTWIDLNVPCHGVWAAISGNAGRQNARMRELAALYGGSDVDHEAMPPALPAPKAASVPAQRIEPAAAPAREPETSLASARQPGATAAPAMRTVKLPGGQELRLVRIPTGSFSMGSADGGPDERPVSQVRVQSGFWMGQFEVTNAQYALFDPTHDSGVVSMHNKDHDTRGYDLTGPAQPVVRVSWQDAMRFCEWLSKQTGETFALPTEAQWEYAARAGSAGPFWFGGLDTDFSRFANLGDRNLRSLAVQGLPPRPVANPDPLLDWVPKEDRFDDGALITANVGLCAANPWGLYDMLGNAAEWTRTAYRPYPYNAADGREGASADGDKVVRGGSWFDRPKRCTSSFRLSYPAWQGVYNVGFRVICLSAKQPGSGRFASASTRTGLQPVRSIRP